MSDEKLFGFADLHCHPMAHLGFGGAVFSGAPDGKPEEALCRCDRTKTTANHGLFGLGFNRGWSLAEVFVEGRLGHGCCGFPTFKDWPRHDTVVHQQMFASWVRRAYDGGLRLMCAVAVNNELLAKEFGAKKRDDTSAIQAQVKGMRAFVDAHADWMGIAENAAEARALVRDNKLAVVLSVEVDSVDKVLGGDAPLTVANVAERLAQFRADTGVAMLTPIHLADNSFGGAAVYSDQFNVLNHFLRGRFYDVEATDEVGFRLADSKTADWASLFVYWLFYGVSYPKQLYRALKGGHRNKKGLTELGRALVDGMMRLGMVLDVDHMSQHTLDQVLEVAQAADYPVVSSHSTYRDLALRPEQTGRPEKLAHEGMKTRLQLQRILDGDGVVAPITNQGDLNDFPGASVRNDCARSSKSFAQAYLYARSLQQEAGKGGVALGTDFNGLALQPGPRYGPEAASALQGDPLRTHLRGIQQKAQNASPRLPYEGTMHRTATPFTRSQEGTRTFDFNTDGLAHYGLLPDLIRDLLHVGMRAEELDQLFGSADAFIRMWERCEQRAEALGAGSQVRTA